MPKKLYPDVKQAIYENPLSPGNGWNPLDYPVNFCILGGQKSPGLFLIDNGSFKSNWQRANIPGMTGAAARFLGEYAVEFTGTVFLVNQVHWEKWKRWVLLFDIPKKGDPPTALSWWHPITQMRKNPVREVVIEEYEFPKHLGGGLWSSTIQFAEYRRPKMAASKPEPAKIEEPADDFTKEATIKTAIVKDLEKIANRPRK